MALSRSVLRDLIGRQLAQQVRFAASAPATQPKKPEALSQETHARKHEGSVKKVEHEAMKVADPETPKVTSMFDEWGTVYVSPYTKNWKPMPKDFKEHPDRDLANFPHPEMKLRPDKVRLGFIPDKWFLAFYEKTGVTGPYLFGIGLWSFLISKEIVVLEEEMSHMPPLLFINYMVLRLFGHKVEGYYDEVIQNDQIGPLSAVRDQELTGVKQFRSYVDTANKAYDTLLEVLPEVRRENVALELEAVYRERVNQVYKETKRRVEYLVESESVKRRFEQQHMVNWIVDQVTKSFGPEQEKKIMSKCIGDLKTLAKSA
uniref:ATP synthase subunit b n=1 Tax=Plectus sambesii TaxID=2011161 RepID=A0A914W3J1_9BILA